MTTVAKFGGGVLNGKLVFDNARDEVSIRTSLLVATKKPTEAG